MTHQGFRSTVQGISVISSKLGVCAAKRSVAIGLRTLDADQETKESVTEVQLHLAKFEWQCGYRLSLSLMVKGIERTRSCGLSCSDYAARRSLTLESAVSFRH